ncbi:MAG TPA: O-antigen ligase family protein [Candidatus Kapabacteria bacterium]|nr:O-antigen ligase family protein [Candidatus Kapabacteria bacterium]
MMPSLPIRAQSVIFVISIALGATCFFDIPYIYICSGLIGIFFLFIVCKDPALILYGLLIFVPLAKFKSYGTIESHTNVFEIAGGILLLGSIAYIFYHGLITKKITTYHPAILALSFVAIWGLLIAIPEMIDGRTDPNFWFREFLIFWSIVAVPLLYREASKRSENFEHNLFVALLVAWLLTIALSFIKIRSTITEATYLFETGTSRVGAIGMISMFVIMLSLFSSGEIHANRKWLIAGLILTCFGLILTFERAIWVSLVFFIPILITWFPRKQRDKSVFALLLLLGIFTFLGILLYATTPLFATVLKWTISKFTSSSQVGTDISLVNRYIEWRSVLNQIGNAPITGLGFGGMYKLYGWIVGVTSLSGYTHNTYLGWMLKFGIIGFVFLSFSYLSIIFLGVRLSYSSVLKLQEKLMLRSGVIILLLCMVRFIVENGFAERSDMLYIGLIWGFIIVKYEQARSVETRTINPAPSRPK